MNYEAWGCKTQKKPPIGINPYYIWFEKRIWELDQAIVRYQESKRIIPVIWVKERNWLIKQLEERPFEEDADVY